MRRLRRLAKARGLAFRYDPRRGKGSHGRLILGDRLTTIKDPRAEIGKGLLRAMLRDLGLEPDDLR
jgi:mRNA interferase HicA